MPPPRRRRTNEQMMRDGQALDLRRRNLNYRQIAVQMGWRSPSRAYEAVQRALLDIQVENAEEVRRVEVERLDDLARAAWRVLGTKHPFTTQRGSLVIDPETGDPLIDDGPVLSAIDRLLKISERRAKLLGLDAPAKVEVITLDAIEAEIGRLNVELAVNDPPAAVEAGHDELRPT